jgi:hypothetical protein
MILDPQFTNNTVSIKMSDFRRLIERLPDDRSVLVQVFDQELFNQLNIEKYVSLEGNSLDIGVTVKMYNNMINNLKPESEVKQTTLEELDH